MGFDELLFGTGGKGGGISLCVQGTRWSRQKAGQRRRELDLWLREESFRVVESVYNGRFITGHSRLGKEPSGSM